MKNEYDVLIAGAGVAGLYCALHLDPKLDILILSKGLLEENDTYLAQGGISTARNIHDIPQFIEDTLNAGQYLNDSKAVEVLADESMTNINYIKELGMPLDTSDNGQLSYTKEGAHSINRIVHVKDETGKFLWETLIKEVKNHPNITMLENTMLFDLLVSDNICHGAMVYKNKIIELVYSKHVVLATGGIGGIFKNSTNQKLLTGDALALAIKYSITIKDLDYIQIHPTGLYDNNYYGRRFLISEAVRGEGGILLNEKGKRFVDELQPRDVVTRAILNEIYNSKLPYVFLDISFLDRSFILNRFPLIHAKCAQIGIDITKDPMLVIPSQHYHMGGIKVDLNSKTSMTNLYAIGECSCTGIHGKNRLASNSLLEGLVFSKRAAYSINYNIEKTNLIKLQFKPLIGDMNIIQKQYKKILINEIKRRSDEFDDELFDYR